MQTLLSEGFYEKVLKKKFPKFTRKNLYRSLFFDKVRRCRSAASFKMRFQRRCFLANFSKFVRTSFLQNTAGRLLLITAVSLVVKRELRNKTVCYDTKFKAYQFEAEVYVIKKGRPGKRNGLTGVFKGVLNKNRCN